MAERSTTAKQQFRNASSPIVFSVSGKMNSENANLSLCKRLLNTQMPISTIGGQTDLTAAALRSMVVPEPDSFTETIVVPAAVTLTLNTQAVPSCTTSESVFASES